MTSEEERDENTIAGILIGREPNPHQPTFDVLAKDGLKCEAPGCNYYLHVPREEWLETWKPYFRREHTDQFDHDRARNITVEWVISATCSVCPDGGEVDTVDGESIECLHCGTTWSMDGSNGYRHE